MLVSAKKVLVHAKVHACFIQNSSPNEVPEFGSFCGPINVFLYREFITSPKILSPELKTQYSWENAFFAFVLVTYSEIYDHYIQNSARDFQPSLWADFFLWSVRVSFHFHNPKVFYHTLCTCRGKKRKEKYQSSVAAIYCENNISLNVYLKFQPETRLS